MLILKCSLANITKFKSIAYYIHLLLIFIQTGFAIKTVPLRPENPICLATSERYLYSDHNKTLNKSNSCLSDKVFCHFHQR